MYKTHKAGGAVAGLLLFTVMQQKGMVTDQINPFVQLLVMWPGISWGSTAPDLDHHWESVKEKTPFNMLFHKILHRTHPDHRSWQTHSILVTGGFLLMLWMFLFYGYLWFDGINGLDWLLMRMVLAGIITGAASHLVLDLLTPSGIWLYPGLKLRLAPRREFFVTDGPWETIVYRVCIVVSTMLLVGVLAQAFDYDIWSVVWDKTKVIFHFALSKV